MENCERKEGRRTRHIRARSGMYYDTYRGRRQDGRRRRRRRRSCLGWLAGAFVRLLIFVLVLAVLAAGALYILPVSFLNIESPGSYLALNPSLPGDRVNILLMGLDYMEDGHQRSDSMIIASVGKDSVRLASILRDTRVEIPERGANKINAAYAMGGAEMSMRVVNETFGMNITNYVAIDLKTLVDLVDAVGGIDIEVEEKELEQLNKYAYNTYKKISADNPGKYAHYASSQPITQAGNLHLNGLFATSFSRIRKVGYDYARTARQQEVIQAVLKEIRAQIADPRLYVKLFEVYNESVQTNLALPELISLGEKILMAGEFETDRFPREANRYDNGSSIEITNAEANREDMRSFLYAGS